MPPGHVRVAHVHQAETDWAEHGGDGPPHAAQKADGKHTLRVEAAVAVGALPRAPPTDARRVVQAPPPRGTGALPRLVRGSLTTKNRPTLNLLLLENKHSTDVENPSPPHGHGRYEHSP